MGGGPCGPLGVAVRCYGPIGRWTPYAHVAGKEQLGRVQWPMQETAGRFCGAHTGQDKWTDWGGRTDWTGWFLGMKGDQG